MICDCKDWRENIAKVNAPLMLQAARSGFDSSVRYDGKQFTHCPWCGSELRRSILEPAPSVPSPTEALTASGVSASPNIGITNMSKLLREDMAERETTRNEIAGASTQSSPSPLVSVEEWTEALCDQFCDEVQIGYSCKQEYLDKREELKKRLRVIVNASLASLTVEIERLKQKPNRAIPEPGDLVP